MLQGKISGIVVYNALQTSPESHGFTSKEWRPHLFWIKFMYHIRTRPLFLYGPQPLFQARRAHQLDPTRWDDELPMLALLLDILYLWRYLRKRNFCERVQYYTRIKNSNYQQCEFRSSLQLIIVNTRVCLNHTAEISATIRPNKIKSQTFHSFSTIRR
jgi:hypothetical protein